MSDPTAPRDPSPGGGPIQPFIDRIVSELGVLLGRPAVVAAACSEVGARLHRPLSPDQVEQLRRLAPPLREREGEVAAPVFDLLENACRDCAKPWPLLQAMLQARDAALALRALGLLGDTGIDQETFRSLARLADEEGSHLRKPAALGRLAGLLEREPNGPGSLRDLLIGNGDAASRRLAARILDRGGDCPGPETTVRLLGPEATGFLRPFLDYTRATHLDLLSLATGDLPRTVRSLREVQASCGRDLLREAIGALGWPRVRLGMEARRLVGVSLGGSLPFVVSPAEARLLQECGPGRRAGEMVLLVAHGGEDPASETRSPDLADPVATFRAVNLAHAALLGEIMDLAPLTRERVVRILGLMDGVVRDFLALFSSHEEECAILPEVYRDLRSRIVREMEAEGDRPEISAELTRLVQVFEDPPSVGAVRTLHGLKRYLHQRGLRLGFRLVRAARGADRTVDLVLASPRGIRTVVRRIRYADFEPTGVTPEGALPLPYPVLALVDGFGAQLVRGRESFPDTGIFCYGNEVHYFLSFGSHPAFLRVDFWPPLQGGMVDLEFFGVSKADLTVHPGPELQGLHRFLRRLDFEVEVLNTHVHARYDKERTVDLGDLRERVEALFRLLPHLMDIDWVIGSLVLPPEARALVAEAWAERFAEWGALPLEEILSPDRASVVAGIAREPQGDRPVAWSGRSPYVDRFTGPLPEGFLRRLRAAAEALGLETSLPHEDDGRLGQVRIERDLLTPLRRAVRRGELVESGGDYHRAGPEAYRAVHETEVFAGILDAGPDALVESARVASLVSHLERSLRFRTSGDVNGHEVQRAPLPFRDGEATVFVLRDPQGMARLAFLTADPAPAERRAHPGGAWRSNVESGAAAVASLLRSSGYFPAGASAGDLALADLAGLRDTFLQPGPARHSEDAPGERAVTGRKASPGRAVGSVSFAWRALRAEELGDRILVSPEVRPEDSPAIFHCAGLVSTGGGILSHAGLIATEFRKPALIVPGRWLRPDRGPTTLVCTSLHSREERRVCGSFEVTIRRDIHEREIVLREGDLVALDADRGILRVLGQGTDALALDRGFRMLDEATRQLAHAHDPREILAFRGRRLQARHQIERLLARLADPALASHAVRELALGDARPGIEGARAERGRLLEVLIAHPRLGLSARRLLDRILDGSERRLRSAVSRAERHIPDAQTPYEVLSLRLEVCRLQDTLWTARHVAPGAAPPAAAEGVRERVDALARERLEEILRTEKASLQSGAADDPVRRHRLRTIQRLDRLLGSLRGKDDPMAAATEGLALRDAASLQAASGKAVLCPADGGLELAPLLGWKGANLAEVERLGGAGLVPGWFALSDRVFREMLDARVSRVPLSLPLPGEADTTLAGAIAAILSLDQVSDSQKSQAIRSLWSHADFPPGLAAGVIEAYRRLGRESGNADPDHPFVAVRSSSREEDTEVATRAGEFETFLFVRGDQSLLEHLKQAWSGLWTERAIHNRAALRTDAGTTGGGILVQRAVLSRVSGVLQTVNAAEGDAGEMVINVGLGLGQGIVSGLVPADHVLVTRPAPGRPPGPLRFRYATQDKVQQVVFDRRSGRGTLRTETRYHQRLRPALEYLELCELVATAFRLEEAYGYPLDIEFALEGPRLWILQVRPVGACQAAWFESPELLPPVPAAREALP